MLMLRQLQTSLNNFIERFQDRWETQPTFRATWSIVGCAFAVVFLCSSLLVSLNIANAITAGNTKTTSSANANVLYAGGNGQQPTYPVGQAPSVVVPTQNANPIATSNAPTPPPTVSPTPFGATPGPTGTPSDSTGTPSPTLPPSVTVTAQQQPALWLGSAPNNQITTVTTAPAVPDAPIVFTLDFGCGNPVKTNAAQLDGNGKVASIAVTIPNCFKSQTTSTQVNVSATIAGQQVTVNPTTFYAKGQ